MKLRSASAELPSHPYGLVALAAITAVVFGLGVSQGEWLYVVGALLICFVLLYPVQIAFGLFALLIPFDAISVLGHGEKGTTFTALAGAGTAAVLLGVGLAARRLQSIPKAGLWWALFALWCLVTSAWALNPDSSVGLLPTIFSLLGLYLVSTCFRYSERELKTIIVLTILGGCAAAIWTTYLFYHGTFYSEQRASLLAGGRAVNPDELAMTLLLPISLGFGYFLSCKRRLAKFGMLVAMGITIVGLLFTMSRAGMVALLAMLLVYVYRMRVRSRLIVPIILILIGLSFMPATFFSRLQEAGPSGGSGRTDIWTVGLKAFEHYAALGAGLNNFPDAYTNYMSYAPHYQGSYRDAHNIYITIGVETGLIGLLLFVGAIVAQFRTALRLKGTATIYNLLPATEAACWGVLVFGFFGTITWTKGFWLPWILLSAAMTAAKNSRSGELLPTPFQTN